MDLIDKEKIVVTDLSKATDRKQIQSHKKSNRERGVYVCV